MLWPREEIFKFYGAYLDPVCSGDMPTLFATLRPQLSQDETADLLHLRGKNRDGQRPRTDVDLRYDFLYATDDMPRNALGLPDG